MFVANRPDPGKLNLSNQGSLSKSIIALLMCYSCVFSALVLSTDSCSTIVSSSNPAIKSVTPIDSTLGIWYMSVSL